MKAINKIRLEIAYDNYNRDISNTRTFIHEVMTIAQEEYPTATPYELGFVARKWDKQYKKN